MLRRLVPLSALAAVVVVPGVASAAPAASPVTAIEGESYDGSATVPLSDGSTVHVTLSKYRSSGATAWQGYLSVWIDSACDMFTCRSTSGSASLTGDQVRFSRTLDTASATQVPLTLTTWSGFGTPPAERQVTVSVAFTGQGAVTRTFDSSTECQEDGSDSCISRRYDETRSAFSSLVLGADSGTAAGTLSHDLGIDVTPRTPSGS